MAEKTTTAGREGHEKNIQNLHGDVILVSKILKCSNCNKEFETKQRNPKQYPKLCPECKDLGGKCETCGTKIPYYRKFCSKKCQENSNKTKMGHKNQGERIKGLNNPAKRLDVREKIIKGVTQSYINDPDLKFHRGRTYPIRATWGRRFLDGNGNKLKSLLELNIAQILQRRGFKYEYEPSLFFGGHYRYPDFRIKNVIIEVCGYIINNKTLKNYIEKLKSYLIDTTYDIIFLVPEEKIYHFFNVKKEFLNKGRHLDILALKGREIELNITNLRTVSYSHFLEWYVGQCQKLHSHSSYIIDLHLQGPINSKWLLDFKDAKVIANSILELIDHKVVVNRSYITFRNEKKILISWKGRSAELLPEDVYVIDSEPTCENITCHLSDLMLEKFKEFGVVLLALSFREGINNGVTAYSQIEYHVIEELEKIINYHLNICYPNKIKKNDQKTLGVKYP